MLNADGVIRCGKYAFGPNRLHYCGPDANQELLAHIQYRTVDPRLERMLKAFNTLYPYLELIARANNIRDPFDDRVVRAYWLGNDLLDRVSRQDLYRSLLEAHHVRDTMNRQSFDTIKNRIGMRALPHHSFHVFNIWQRTGHTKVAHTIESIDSCRIGWGTITGVDGPFIAVDTQTIAEHSGKLCITSGVLKKLTRSLESREDIEQVKVGDIITYHWEVPCEVISKRQSKLLEKYTLQSMALANTSELNIT